MGELKAALARCRTDWLICAVSCVAVFILCEATALWVLLDSFGMGLRKGTTFFTACIGFFFSAITPSSTGGQPMEVYYLRKKGIPVSVSSAILLVMAAAYKLVLSVVGLGLLIIAPGFLKAHLGGMMFLYYIGLALTAGLTALLFLFLFRPGIARGILIGGMTVLEELHLLKDREIRQRSLEMSMDVYSDASEHLRKCPGVLLEVLGIMLLRRLALFSVTWCVYRALGLSGSGWWSIILLQASISVSADMLPLPGGMGVSEGLFIKAFGAVFGAAVLPGMVLSRGIGHYSQLILCAAVSLTAIALLRRRHKEDEYES